jgi:hypothetical protein
VEELIRTVQQSEPVEHDRPGYGWRLKQVRRWVKQVLRCEVSRRTLRTLRKQKGLSWKQCQKVLKQAKPAQRAAFIAEFQQLFSQVCQEKLRLISIDEAHVPRAMALGYPWAAQGKPAWRLGLLLSAVFDLERRQLQPSAYDPVLAAFGRLVRPA